MRRVAPALLLLLLLLPVAARGEETPPVRPPLSGPVAERTLWYGVYVLGQKAGWAHEDLRRLGTGRAALYVATMQMRFEVRAMGQSTRMEFGQILAFDGNPPYALRRGRSITIDEGGERIVRLDAGPDGARAFVTENGETRALTPDPVDYTFEDYVATDAWMKGGRSVGDVLRVRSYDLDELVAEVDTYTVTGREQTIARGVPVTVYEVTSTSDREGEQGVVRMDADGRVVSMAMGTMFEIRLEPEEVAKQLSVGADLFELGTARVAGRIGDPTKVRELVLEAYGDGASSLPDGPRQTVGRDEATDVVLLRLGRAHGRRLVATPEEVAEALRETVELPIHHPEVAAMASQAIGDAATDAEKVARLVAFVSKHVEDSVTVHDPTVLGLVRNGRGDCTEHAKLFAALARAVGIPARQVSGLMYMGDGEQAFGGHAWNEVVLDGAWVQVDATWDQTDVDATHITLSRTERDQSVQFRTYGGLRFVVRRVVSE